MEDTVNTLIVVSIIGLVTFALYSFKDKTLLKPTSLVFAAFSFLYLIEASGKIDLVHERLGGLLGFTMLVINAILIISSIIKKKYYVLLLLLFTLVANALSLLGFLLVGLAYM